MSLDRTLTHVLGSGFAGGLAGGLASGLLTSKAGRKFGKKALKVGGIAAVGGLAYAAWNRHRAAAGPRVGGDPAPSIERFVPGPERATEVDALGLTLLRAMVCAAQADGRLDAEERQAIAARVRGLDLSEAEKEELLARLSEPVDLNTVVAAAATPELAAEIYAASLLAIDVDTTAERAYLSLLAARLGLHPGLVASLHEELGVPAPDTAYAAQRA